MLKLDPNGEYRECIISIRLTKTDKAEIQRRANAHKMSATSYLRAVALGELDPAEAEDVVSQLRSLRSRLDRVERLVSLGGID